MYLLGFVFQGHDRVVHGRQEQRRHAEGEWLQVHVVEGWRHSCFSVFLLIIPWRGGVPRHHQCSILTKYCIVYVEYSLKIRLSNNLLDIILGEILSDLFKCDPGPYFHIFSIYGH